MLYDGDRTWNRDSAISSLTVVHQHQYGDLNWNGSHSRRQMDVKNEPSGPWLAERVDGSKRFRRDGSCAGAAVASHMTPSDLLSTMMADGPHLPDLIDGPAADLPLLSPSIINESWTDMKVVESVAPMPVLPGTSEMEFASCTTGERGERRMLNDQTPSIISDSCQLETEWCMSQDATTVHPKEEINHGGLLASWPSVGNLLDTSMSKLSPRSHNEDSFSVARSEGTEWTSSPLASSPQASTTQNCLLAGRSSASSEIGQQMKVGASMNLSPGGLDHNIVRHIDQGIGEAMAGSPQLQHALLQHQRNTQLHKRNASIASSDTKDTMMSCIENIGEDIEQLSKETLNFQKKHHQVMSGNLTREFKESILRQIQHSYTNRRADILPLHSLPPIQQLSPPSVLTSPIDTSPTSAASFGIQNSQYTHNGDLFANNNSSQLTPALLNSSQAEQTIHGHQQSASPGLNNHQHNGLTSATDSPLSQSPEVQQHSQLDQLKGQSQSMSSHAPTVTINDEVMERQQQMQTRLDMKKAFEHQQLLLMSNAAAAVADHQAAQNQLYQQQSFSPQGTEMTQPARSSPGSGFSVGARMTPQDVEATVMKQFQDKVFQLDVATRMSIQNSLYRLARSAMGRQEESGFIQSQAELNYPELGRDSSLIGDGKKQTSRNHIDEPTSTADRSVVNMLFFPLCLPGQKYAPQPRPSSRIRARAGNGQVRWPSSDLKSTSWAAPPPPGTTPESRDPREATQRAPDNHLMTWAAAPLMNDYRSPAGASSNTVDQTWPHVDNLTTAPRATAVRGFGYTATQPVDIQAARHGHSPSSSMRSGHESYSPGGQAFNFGGKFNEPSSYDSHDGSLTSGYADSSHGVDQMTSQTFAMMNVNDANRPAAGNDLFHLSGNSQISCFPQDYQGSSHFRQTANQNTSGMSYFDQRNNSRLAGLMGAIPLSHNHLT